ncbi:MAG: carbon storage regulator [Thermoguttaceae bacterium]
MLVLSRREGERIKIGENITLTVVRCSGDKVRIGVDAPPEVLVLRGELHPHNREEGFVATKAKDKETAEPREESHERRPRGRFTGRRRIETDENAPAREHRSFESGFRQRPGAPVDYPVASPTPTPMFQ